MAPSAVLYRVRRPSPPYHHCKFKYEQSSEVFRGWVTWWLVYMGEYTCIYRSTLQVCGGRDRGQIQDEGLEHMAHHPSRFEAMFMCL